MLAAILPPIEESAASIESTFLQAGDSLTQGLSAFESLNADLAALSEALSGGGMASASHTLDRLSHALDTIAAALPVDAATMLALQAGNQSIAALLAVLLEDIRMMTIIARTARIEAVVFDEEGIGLEGFTREIGRLIDNVKGAVNACHADHSAMAALVNDAARIQAALDRDYRERLLQLSADLRAVFGVLEGRQREGLVFMQDVGTRVRRLAQAGSMALVALQTGDATRQRLEHVAHLTRQAMALQQGGLPDVPEAARLPALGALCRVCEMQVRDTVEEFGAESGRIDDALRLLLLDTQEVVGLGQETFGEQRDAAAVLRGFHAHLARARALIRTCEASRQTVEQASLDLRRRLAGLHETMSMLSVTSLDLVLVGLNAGLKATRLGPRGRSFVVIADELKRLANKIAAVSQALLPLSGRVLERSHDLDRPQDETTMAKSALLDQSIASIAEELAQGDRKIDALLVLLHQKGAAFGKQLTRARRDFEAATTRNQALLECAQQLAAAVPDGADLIADTVVDALALPCYTMQRERDIHAAALPRAAPALLDAA